MFHIFHILSYYVIDSDPINVLPLEANVLKMSVLLHIKDYGE